jgi:hypothetical protein
MSYHRRDNEDFLQVVEQLKSEIGGRFAANTGRTLDIFLDRDSIGWGADWRESIREAVLSASFFIPVITMRFFESEICREEFMTFYENARQLGVTDLIMPIVLAGSDLIRDNHPEEIVRIVESLNYISIGTAWEAGYRSPEWVRVVNRMVRDLAGYLTLAETELSLRETRDETGSSSREDADAPDIEALTDSVTEATERLADAMAAMQALAASLTQVLDEVNAQPLPAGKRAALTRGAGAIAQTAQQFADEASGMEQKVAATDVHLRSVISELREIGSPQAEQQLETLRNPLRTFPDLQEQIAMIDDATRGIRMASLANVTMRNALRPAARAFQSLRAGFSTAQTWGSL